MIEIFNDIRQEVKDTAELAWTLALHQSTPIKAAELLNIIIEYYKAFWTTEEINFLQFYFNMQMEMNKDD